jgi:hypothetical protein
MPLPMPPRDPSNLGSPSTLDLLILALIYLWTGFLLGLAYAAH